MPPTRRGKSLAEMLVVVGIVLLLAGLIVSGASRLWHAVQQFIT